jgi:uncharacterized protein YdeI (BOF family)
MLKKGSRLVSGLAVVTVLASVNCYAANTVCSVTANRVSFDHKNVTLQGTAIMVRETTSRRGNDYTTFKLHDPNGACDINVFIWGHQTLTNGDRVQVDGVFETEYHQGQYTFYNEVESTNVAPLSR